MTETSKLNAVREDFYAELAKQNMAPLWSVLSTLVPAEPPQTLRGALWRYEDARDHLMRAGEIISAEEAERRVLILENPSVPGEARATQTLYAGLQLILPGEIAPCHRHTQSALRFVMEGEGAYTAVDGEKAFMSPFDLILTPAGAWHDHGNPSSSPTIWLDGLDIPMVSAFGVGFAEKLPDARAQHPETRQPGETIVRHGAALRLVEDRPPPRANPLFHYPYAMWRDALLHMAQRATPDPASGVTMEFVDPRTGGSVSPTMSASPREAATRASRAAPPPQAPARRCAPPRKPPAACRRPPPAPPPPPPPPSGGRAAPTPPPPARSGGRGS
jgi:gentisate 1,2-dioxygenase